MINIGVQLEFLSDWAIGSGHARHDSLDLLIRRDADGLPYVPGKTLRGIWRDSAEQVAIGLDNGSSKGVWSRWCRYVWGDQPDAARGVLMVPSARIPEPWRVVVLSDSALARSVVVTRAATAIEPSNGIAKHNSLRIEERARAGMILSTDATLDLPKIGGDVMTSGWPALFLVLAAARSIDRLGGRRRRGAGRCTLNACVVAGGETWEQLLQRARAWEQDLQIPEPPPGRVADGLAQLAPVSVPALDGREPVTAWRRLVIRIKTVDPVLVGARVLGNAVLSHQVIPGSTLLPVIAEHLGPQSTALIRDEELVVSDAVPVKPGDVERSLPMPLCLTEPKVYGEGEVECYVNEMQSTLLDADGRRRQTKSTDGFLQPAADDARTKIAVRRTDLITTFHNVIDDQTQRPGQNGLYSYEAIAPDQLFAFEVITEPSAAELLKSSLRGVVRLGGSRSAEYGRVEVLDIQECGGPNSRAHAGLAAGESFAVWLTADILPRGGPTVAALLAELSSELGTGLALADDVEVSTAFVRHSRRESWQTRWGLPRPSLVGIAAGSCLRVVPENEVAPKAIARVEAAGVGERRVEGFGRLVIDPPLLRHDQLFVINGDGDSGWAAADGRSAGGPEGQRAEPGWLSATREATVGTLLADAALVAATNSALLPQSLSRAQVGGLRDVADRLVDSHGAEAAAAWLVGIKASTARATEWGKSWQWLNRLIIGGADAVWSEFGAGTRKKVEEVLGPLLTKERKDTLPREALRLLLLAAVQAHRVGVAGVPSKREREASS